MFSLDPRSKLFPLSVRGGGDRVLYIILYTKHFTDQYTGGDDYLLTIALRAPRQKVSIGLKRFANLLCHKWVNHKPRVGVPGLVVGSQVSELPDHL